MKTAYPYTTETVKKTVLYKNSPVLAVNIKYPVFESSANARKFALRINSFYSDTAKKYIARLSSSGAKKAAKIRKTNGNILPSFVMSCTVAYSDAEYVSVFVDVSVYDGVKTKTRRFSQLWSVSKARILPHTELFDSKIRSQKYIKQLICDIAKENMQKGSFSYFSNYRRIINKKLSFENFYVVPNGIAFYIDEGVLSDRCEVCVFVLPFERIDGVLKIIFVKL